MDTFLDPFDPYGLTIENGKTVFCKMHENDEMSGQMNNKTQIEKDWKEDIEKKSGVCFNSSLNSAIYMDFG